MVSLIWKKAKNSANELFAKQRQIHQMYKAILWCKVGRRVDLEDWNYIYTLLFIKWITSKDLLYHTGDSAQQCNDCGERI